MKLKDIFPEEKDYSTISVWMGLIGHDGGKVRSEKKRKACAENIKKRWSRVREQTRQAEPGPAEGMAEGKKEGRKVTAL